MSLLPSPPGIEVKYEKEEEKVSYVLALRAEFPPWTLEDIEPAECVDFAASALTTAMVKHIQGLIKWRRTWEEQDEATRIDRAQEGHHPFAPGTKQPWDPSSCPPYRPRNSEEK